MKNQIDRLDAVPSKGLFWSIIADYDLNKAICELIDNAIDMWTKDGKSNDVKITIDIDIFQQSITVQDNAGGVKKSDLVFMVSPGQTGNDELHEVIGFFGVGTKRAVVALAQDIKIITRHNNESTYLIEIDDTWLGDADWDLPIYEVSSIPPRSTKIELNKLRYYVTEATILNLKEHLRATYALFLYDKKVKIILCSEELEPILFENWAYPPDYLPRKYCGKISFGIEGFVNVEIRAGLSLESSPTGEYGVYFYCNNRLVARALKSYEVGFAKGLAGQPHPGASLVKIIVLLQGHASLMPWNSSKSGLNYNHKLFNTLHDRLVAILAYNTSLSRRLEGKWAEEVFKYTKGKMLQETLEVSGTKLYLPPLPMVRPRYADKIKQENSAISKVKPWVRGLYESVVAVDILYKQKLDQKNRICLIILDSTLEIAFKEFLVNDSGHYYKDEDLRKIFEKRHEVHREVQKYTDISQAIWKKINHYYFLRCKLVHERANAGVSNLDVEEYREVVEDVLAQLFSLKFEA